MIAGRHFDKTVAQISAFRDCDAIRTIYSNGEELDSKAVAQAYQPCAPTRKPVMGTVPPLW